MGIRRSWLIAALLVALTAACTDDSDPIGGDENPEVARDVIQFGDSPSKVVEHGGSMWIADRRRSTVGKVDPTDGVVTAEIDLDVDEPATVWDIESAGEFLWATITPKRYFLQLDPSSGEIVREIRTRGRVSDLYSTGETLWFRDDSPKRGMELVRLDPQTGKRLASLPLGNANTHVIDVAAIGGSIWVVREHNRFIEDDANGQATFFHVADLWEVNPKTNRVVKRRPLGTSYTRGAVNPIVSDVEPSEDGLWISRVLERRIVLVDPHDMSVDMEFVIGAFELPWEFEVVGRDIWTGELNGGEVMRINIESRERELLDIGREASFIGSGFGSVWIPVSPGEVHRLTAPGLSI